MSTKTTLEFLKDIRIVKIMLGTNERVYSQMLSGDFNTLVWASDNLETVAHYYEGCVVEMQIMLDGNKMEYVSNYIELDAIGSTIREYSYGLVTTNCPKDAVWYCFSARYLKTYLISIKEIFPDLSPWNEAE